MNWDLLDYLTFGALLTIVVVIVMLARGWSQSRNYRAGAAVAAAGAFFLVWINGAVGIIGNEENPSNLLFFGVLAVAAFGSVIARFRARGLAITFCVTAASQILVAAYAIIADLGEAAPVWPRDILAMTVFFSVFWIVSGWLFSRAAIETRGEPR